MTIPKWQFIVTDLHGAPVGEVLNANSRNVVIPLNRVPTASFQVPLQSALSPTLLDPTADLLLKAYRNKVLRFHGPVVSSAEAFDENNGQVVAVNAAGALWKLSYRLLGIPPDGGATPNLLPSGAWPSFEDGVAGMVCAGGGAVFHSAAHAKSGKYCALVIAGTGNPSSMNLYLRTNFQKQIKVTAGDTYTFSCHSLANSTPANFHCEIQWYNASGTLLSLNAGGATTDNTSTWSRASVSAVAPGGAAYALPAVYWSASAAGEIHFADAGQFTLSNAAVTYADDPKVAQGWSFGDADTTYDLGHIAQEMLITANASGFTGISNGTNTPSSDGSAGTYFFQDVLTALGDLSTGLNSFDFEAVPTEPTDVGQPFPQIALFNTSNLIGTTKSNVIFEYGTPGANVTQYSRQIDRSQLCTEGFIEQPGVSDNSDVLTSVDAAAEVLRGRYQALIDNGGVEWNTLRQALADLNVKIRKNPRQVVTFTPKPNADFSPFDDYITGDEIRARIDVQKVNVLDAMLRVWGITFDINENGDEQPTLELIQP